MTFVIRGRSIDGTVWLYGDDSNISWTQPFGEGVREFNTQEEGNPVAQRLRDSNKGREIDEYIGHIEVVTKPTPTDKLLTTKQFLDAFDKELLTIVSQEAELVKKANPTFDHYRAVGHAIEGVSEARELPGEVINALRYFYEDGEDDDSSEQQYFESQLRAIEERQANKSEDADSFYARCEEFRPGDEEG